jgi:hypothetical protein
MTDPRNLPSAWSRPLLALLAGFALAFTMMTPHDMAVEQAGGISQVEIAETAVHPDAPAHLEDAEFEVHSGCVACLLQLGSNTVLGRPLALQSPLPQVGHLATPLARISSAKPSLLGPARAPPIFSPSA